jgi:hypothetical protein
MCIAIDGPILNETLQIRSCNYYCFMSFVY